VAGRGGVGVNRGISNDLQATATPRRHRAGLSACWKLGISNDLQANTLTVAPSGPAKDRSRACSGLIFSGMW